MAAPRRSASKPPPPSRRVRPTPGKINASKAVASKANINAVNNANANASFKRSSGGIDLGKFVGEVGANLSRFGKAPQIDQAMKNAPKARAVLRKSMGGR